MTAHKSEALEGALHKASGTKASWYRGWNISEESRSAYRESSRLSREAKKAAENAATVPIWPLFKANLRPELLMPQQKSNGLRVLSLFSGGGGLDLGFDLAGFRHVASYERLLFACVTLKNNRPEWSVFSGDEGDVTAVDWKEYEGKVDIIQGGPPCQPFSHAGRQKGADDARDMFPEFVRSVLEIRPKAFVAENVPGLATPKFVNYVQETILTPLGQDYNIRLKILDASSFGVPQKRRRLFFVGIRKELDKIWNPPEPTHVWNPESSGAENYSLFSSSLPECMGARRALGLPAMGFDDLAPTIRSGLTGPRHTTSILSSTSAARAWEALGLWPNGVAVSREKARRFPTKNGSFRLAVQDCALLQAFPSNWLFDGAVYKQLGQIGNAVAPPVAYHVARSVEDALNS